MRFIINKLFPRPEHPDQGFRLGPGALLRVLAWPVLAAFIAILGWHNLLQGLDKDKAAIEAAAQRESASLARSYADHLQRNFEAIDRTLLHLRHEWILSQGQLKLEELKESGVLPSSSFFLASIAGPDGVIRSGTMPPFPSNYVGAMPFFESLRQTDAEYLYIGTPVTGPLSGDTVIHFARRITDQNGGFAGVVSAAVRPAFFTIDYDNTSLGPAGFLGVFGKDGKTWASRIGETVHDPVRPDLAAERKLSSPTGSALLPGAWFIDQRDRYAAWETLSGYPLVAMAGLDQQTLLAPYRKNRAERIRSAWNDTLVLVIFTLIAMWQSLRLAWRKQQLETTRNAYRVATEEGNDGFFIMRPVRDNDGTPVDFTVTDSNQRGAGFLDLRREQVLGRHISWLVGAEDFQRLATRLEHALESGFYENEAEFSGPGMDKPRWMHLRIVRTGAELAVTMRDISQAKAHIKELERRGNEDLLTGLPNRHWVVSYLPDSLRRAGASGRMLAILFVDLDGFKTVNDTWGHLAGDELLRLAAQRLRMAVRPHDKVVRWGGDEFVILLEQIADADEAEQVAGRILEAFAKDLRISHGTQRIGTSIGISFFPRDGQDAQALLEYADIAMYSVKTGGKGDYRFYDEKFYTALRTRRQWENALREAIEDDQFVLHYQPRMDLNSGKLASMEALVRWDHPERGLLQPLEFIPLAEETGLILPLGELVIDKVCAQLAAWAGPQCGLVPVSINVSPRQFNETDVARIVSAALERHRVSAGLVEIELTESSMMGESGEVARSLSAIQEMGIRLSVDDFGTGYSSLAQLQRLDFDVLKVDRAFTHEIGISEQGKVFFTAIITMAHALGMRVVAEGVETVGQVKVLRALRCDEIQGFYVSQPLPAGATQPQLRLA